jgi:ABC-type Mn2+/Zn2+ transport system ATPase subunit
MIKVIKIENGDIFTRDFRPLVKNNNIHFSNNEEIAVIYGPNGTGKTSFIKVLSGDKNTKIEFEYDGQRYSSGQNIFHIINDQNSRNIIAGETKDFLLGDNIKKEFELLEFINQERKRITNSIISMLKENYGISAASNPLITRIETIEIKTLLKI